MKICVYAISKNEEKHVERFCDAAGDADIILVADTGSTDQTLSKLWGWSAKNPNRAEVQTPTISIKPWRFDHARNAALALVPADVDVCVSLDLDEILQPDWRAEIERVWELGKTTQLNYMFDWGLGIAFWYEKIHARHGIFWYHPCHEYPVHDGRVPQVRASTNPDYVMVIHKPDPDKSRGQYLGLLELSVKEDPDEPHNAFYYARELGFANKHEECIKECDRYMTLPLADWHNERCYAYRVKGRSLMALNRPAEAEVAFLQGMAHAPGTREPWVELAELMYKQARWSECFAYASKCLQITDRQKVYTVDPKCWTHWPYTWASIATWNLGLKEQALAFAEEAHRVTPDEPLTASNLAAIKRNMPCPASTKSEATPSAKTTTPDRSVLWSALRRSFLGR